MIGYITLGTNDFEKAVSFYDALLGEIGAKRILEAPNFTAWGPDYTVTSLSVLAPHDGKPATVGNGVMVALNVDSPEKVNAVYKKAIELGATCEGEPGPRQMPGFYAGYFRDLDGNKLNVFHISQG